MHHPFRSSCATEHTCSGFVWPILPRLVPSSLFIALMLTVGVWSLESVYGAETAAKGVVLFTRPPSTYPELLDYVTLTRASIAFSLLVRSDGRRMEIPNSGILGTFEYPPSQPDATTVQRATAITTQIDAALAKFPRAEYREIYAKLAPLAASWRSLQQVAAARLSKSPNVNNSAASPQSVPSRGVTITTADGKTYDDVQVTKVEPDAISFIHSAGVATIDFENLPMDLQRKFNYDPQLGAAARAARKDLNAAAKAAIAATAEASIAPSKSSSTPGRESLKQWIEDKAIIPVEISSGSWEPTYEETLQFINDRISIRHMKLWFGEKSRKMILDQRVEVYVFDPAVLSTDLKLHSTTFPDSGVTTYSLIVSRRSGAADFVGIQDWGDKKPHAANGFTLPCGDSVEADKLARAFQHLIRMFGGKKDLF